MVGLNCELGFDLQDTVHFNGPFIISVRLITGINARYPLDLAHNSHAEGFKNRGSGANRGKSYLEKLLMHKNYNWFLTLIRTKYTIPPDLFSFIF